LKKLLITLPIQLFFVGSRSAPANSGLGRKKMLAVRAAVEMLGKIAIRMLQRRVSVRVSFRLAAFGEFIRLVPRICRIAIKSDTNDRNFRDFSSRRMHCSCIQTSGKTFSVRLIHI
jgi:hypothetical protein